MQIARRRTMQARTRCTAPAAPRSPSSPPCSCSRYPPTFMSWVVRDQKRTCLLLREEEGALAPVSLLHPSISHSRICSFACRIATKRCRSVAVHKSRPIHRVNADPCTSCRCPSLPHHVAVMHTYLPLLTVLQLLRDLVRCGRKFPVVNFSQYVPVHPPPCVNITSHLSHVCEAAQRGSVSGEHAVRSPPRPCYPALCGVECV